MSQLPPVPAANQSPFPVEEPPHASSADPVDDTTAKLEQGIASAKATVGPLAAKATEFARKRPWATAALVGTVALAVFNSLRGKRT